MDLGRPDMSILRFVHWISTSQEVIVYGDGQQKELLHLFQI